MVYGIEALGHNALKIGTAKNAINVMRRYSQIQLAPFAELRIRCIVKGDVRVEHELHRAARLAGLWIRGEWFSIEALRLFDAYTALPLEILPFCACGALTAGSGECARCERAGRATRPRVWRGVIQQ